MSNIYLKNIYHFYDDKKNSSSQLIFRELCLSVSQGKSIAVLGKSGSGKTTLLNIIGLMTNPRKGTIRYNNTNLLSLDGRSKAKFRNQKIGYIFQNYNLISSFSLQENIALPMIINGASKKFAYKKSALLLDTVNLTHKLNSSVSHLSGGEKQRAAIARAVVNEPEFILADEPTGNLDQQTEETIVDLLMQIVRENNSGLIFVTHNNKLADKFDETKVITNYMLC